MNYRAFEKAIDGKNVGLFKLENSRGLKAYISNYGARIIKLEVPDKRAQLIDVVAGFNTLDEYLQSTEYYHGATIGRFCNRIANGNLLLKGQQISLNINDKPNTLHGGYNGFHSVVWQPIKCTSEMIKFCYFSADMEEGYPGNLEAKVTYTLTTDNAIKINYEAMVDKTTIINLTNHSYFNLNGEGNGNILNHKIRINANNYLPVNCFNIPTGEMLKVDDSPFDFRKGFIIGSRIGDHNAQLSIANGYNHTFVIARKALKTPVASLFADKSGITMEVFTDQPGIHLYTGNHFNGNNMMRSGKRDEFRNYLALETQHFPDSPNHPSFPSTILKPGEFFKSFTKYKFI